MSATLAHLFTIIVLEDLGLDGQHMGPVLDLKRLGVGDRLNSLERTARSAEVLDCEAGKRDRT